MRIDMPRATTLENSRQHLELLQRLVVVANRAENLTAGPGVEINKAAGGAAVSIKQSRRNSQPASEPADECSGGTLVTLAASQGAEDADSWEREADDCPVQYEVLTDVRFNETNGQLTFRTRALQFDRCGRLTNVSAESAEILITTAAVCP